MQAKDIMTTNVITISPEASVRDAASAMLQNSISAMPVVSNEGALLGIVSEGDFLRQMQAPEDRTPSWWLRLFQSSEDKAVEYIKSHAKHVKDVMTTKVIAIDETAEISRIAAILEKNRIKRVPVVKDGKVIGIVSRANLLNGLAAQSDVPAAKHADKVIRAAIMEEFDEAIPNAHLINVTVKDGVVNLMGAVATKEEKLAIDVALENVSDVKSVVNDVTILPIPPSSGWV